MLKLSWSSSIVNKTVVEKRHAPCMSSLTAYSHCGSCWCCSASCLGHFPWTMQAPDPSAWRPTRTHLREHSVKKKKKDTECYNDTLKMLHVCFVMQRFNILCSFPCLIEMSLWQQDGTLGLWTLVVRGFVFICISILPSGLSSPPRSVSVYTCSAHLVGSKSACGSSTHFSSGPC